MFVHLLSYFISKKLQVLRKGAHVRGGFSSFNVFILYSIYAMVFMRVLGALYTFIVGVVSLTTLFQNARWELSYEILDELVFPARDFCEVMLFSYLFFFQSKRKQDLEDVNA